MNIDISSYAIKQTLLRNKLPITFMVFEINKTIQLISSVHHCICTFIHKKSSLRSSHGLCSSRWCLTLKHDVLKVRGWHLLIDDFGGCRAFSKKISRPWILLRGCSIASLIVYWKRTSFRKLSLGFDELVSNRRSFDQFSMKSFNYHMKIV